MHSILFFEEGSMQAGPGWMIWIALAIFLLMVSIGWLATSRGWVRKDEKLHNDSSDHTNQAH